MKKIYSILAGALLAGGASLGVMAMPDDADVVLNTNDEGKDTWTAYRPTSIDKGSTNFVKFTSQKPAECDYSYSLANNSEADRDVWLTSPSMELEAGKKYSLEYQYQAYYASSNFQLSNLAVYVVDAPVSASNVEDVRALTPIYTTSISKDDVVDRAWNQVEIGNKIEGSGTRYIVFHVSGACVGRFSIADIKVFSTGEVAPSTPKPLAPTALTAVPNEDGDISVELSWTLPTLDDQGGALTGDNAVTGVNIYRDDEVIATLKSADTHYTDTELTGLSTGNYTYAVSALTANGEGAKSETVESGWVGPWSWSQATLTLTSDNPAPADSWSFSSNKPVGTIIFIRTNGTNPGNGFTNSVQTFNNNPVEETDVWISSPRLDLPVGKTFKVSFYYGIYGSTDTQIDGLTAYMSSARAASSDEAVATALTGVRMLDVSVATGDLTNSTKWEQVIVKGFEPADTPQYLNFHLAGTVCKGIYISGLTVEEYEEHPFQPSAPTNLTATPASAQKLEVTLNWTNPTTDVDGLPFEASQNVEQVYVYRDGAETPVATLEGAVTTFTDTAETGLEAGSHTYKVQAVVAGALSPMSEEASVIHVGPPTTQNLPMSSNFAGMSEYDFKTLWATYTTGYNSPNWVSRPNGIMLMNNSGYSANSWLISAPLQLDMTKKLEISYNLNLNTSEITPDVKVGLVTSAEPESFVVSVPVTTFGEGKVYFTPEAPARLESYPLAPKAEPQYRLAIQDATQNPSTTYSLTLSTLDIKEALPTGVQIVNAADEEVSIFDLTGKRISDKSQLAKGVYIIRKSNGETTKIIR